MSRMYMVLIRTKERELIDGQERVALMAQVTYFGRSPIKALWAWMKAASKRCVGEEIGIRIS